jgi:3-methylcrotonyl-CoA carboxylase alpha subunit
MKMETVIRSPVEGRVGRIVHGVGEMCKAGTALVEFEEEEEEGK